MIEQTGMSDGVQTVEQAEVQPQRNLNEGIPDLAAMGFSEKDRGKLGGMLASLGEAPGQVSVGDLARNLPEDGYSPPPEMLKYLQENLTPEEQKEFLRQYATAGTEAEQSSDGPTPAPTQRSERGHMPLPEDAQEIVRDGNDILTKAKEVLGNKEILEHYNPEKPPEQIVTLRAKISEWLPKAGKVMRFSLVVALILAIILMNRSFAAFGGKGAKL